jgi:hypothetical protein
VVFLPLAAAIGVTGTLLLDDITFGQLAGLIATLVAILIAGLIWNGLALTPIFGGGLEAVRMVLLIAMLIGVGWLAAWITRRNARLLLK